MKLIDLYTHVDGASPDYIADVLTQGDNPKPTARDPNLKLIGGPYQFTVLRAQPKTNTFTNNFKTATANVIDLVLMDGSMVCFAARLNTSVSHKLNTITVYPGAKLTVFDLQLIWLQEKEGPLDCRMAMLINDFEWHQAPIIDSVMNPDIASAKEWSDDRIQKVQFDDDVTETVYDSKKIIPCNYNFQIDKERDPYGPFWSFLNPEAIKIGYWIESKEGKKEWRRVVANRKRLATAIAEDSESSEEECTCRCNFGLKVCVLELYPLSRCCRKSVYDTAYDRLNGEVDGKDFGDLKNNYKRWCLYYYYSVNVLQHTGVRVNVRRELPSCFVEYVRRMCPNPPGKCYTGCRHSGHDEPKDEPSDTTDSDC